MEEVLAGVTTGWRRNQRRGEVLLESGTQVPFNIHDVTNVDPSKPQLIRNNLPVSVVLKDGQVQSVTILGLPWDIPEPSSEPHPGRFLNPYNFVRNLPNNRPADVMGRVPPPPHDRYVGLTGRMTCTLENVTPLFVSDSHAIAEEPVFDEQGEPRLDAHGKPKKHRKYRFFTISDEKGKRQLAIPASSLRGMLRSVFETLTNSCYAVFDGERKLEFREKPEFGSQVKSNAAIVRKLATEDEPAGEVQLCQTANIGAYYTGDKADQNAKHSRGDDIRRWKSGEYVIARAWRTPNGRYIIREFAETQGELLPLGDNESYLKGWLKITGRGEGTQKWSETLFLDPAQHGSGKKVTFSLEQQEEYNTILAGQKDRGQTPVPLKGEKLVAGDLIWLEMSGNTIKRLVRVQIPRTPFQHTLNDFLPDHLHACQDYDALCPACRVFGWVYQRKRGERIPDDKITAYAGRIRLSHAVITKESGRYKDIPLAILASPKPTETRFYLLNKNGQPDGQVTYRSKGKATLRGRKFYRHHGSPDSGEYVRAAFETPEKDDQNRTVQGALAPGSTFEFSLDFENLAKEELAALLFALELEPGMHHRLGYAKPLGFGSVKIKVKRLELADVPGRWQSLELNAEWRKIPCETWKRLVDGFLQAMKDHYDHDGKAYSVMLKELKTILSSPAADALPIHYPRPEKAPNPEGRQFEWFVGNKRRQQDAETLSLITEEAEGLPIIDKDGVFVE